MTKEMELDCPSGFRVRLRGIKGKDLDGLRDKRRIMTGEAFSRLLDDCTLEILDPGPYGSATTAPVPKWSWKQALIGDRVRGLLGLRSVTSGKLFTFRARCSNTMCRAWIDWEIDLLDMQLRRLPEQSREAFVGGNRFETQLGDDVVVFHLSTGEDQARAVRQREKLEAAQKRQRERGEAPADGQALMGLAARIVEVRRAGERLPDVLAYLGELDLADVTNLVMAMDAVDCGVETTLDIVCEQCGEVSTTELPLDANFFRPTAVLPRRSGQEASKKENPAEGT